MSHSRHNHQTVSRVILGADKPDSITRPSSGGSHLHKSFHSSHLWLSRHEGDPINILISVSTRKKKRKKNTPVSCLFYDLG